MQHKCPVCGIHTFSQQDSYEQCPFCGWVDEAEQEQNPDAPGINRRTLNQMRKAFTIGRASA